MNTVDADNAYVANTVYIGENCVATINPDFKITTPDGRSMRFEWTYFGPVFLKKDYDPKAIQPSEKHYIWPIFLKWQEQGRKVDTEGNCVYDI